MKLINIVKYSCDICGELYSSEKEARGCEERELQDSPVKIGDIVIITGGQGIGKRAKVTDRWVIDKYWGHYAYKRYWHTIGISADIIEDWGTRMLTFDNYELIK